MNIPFENCSEEWGAGRKDDFMCLDLIIIAGKSYIKEVFIFPQLPKGSINIGLKVIPSQAELFSHVNLTL